MPDDRSEERRADYRTSDIWPVIKRNLPAIVVLLSFVISLVTIYNEVKYMGSIVNPESISKWRAEQAQQAEDAQTSIELSNRRWCMTKRILDGETSEQVAMECLD